MKRQRNSHIYGPCRTQSTVFMTQLTASLVDSQGMQTTLQSLHVRGATHTHMNNRMYNSVRKSCVKGRMDS